MKFSKKILLILGIIAFVSIFLMSTSFAASSEKISKWDAKITDSFNKKVVAVNIVSNWNDSWENNEYYKFKIKKQHKNKFKINSIKLKYQNHEGTYIKNYNVKNKDHAYLKIPKKYFVKKITLNYKTKSKLKSESISYKGYKSDSSIITTFNSKKAKIHLKEKGYTVRTEMGGWPTTTYQNFKINTKSPKYKIKSVKILYYSRGNLEKVKTVNGYGKRSLNLKYYEKLYDITSKEFIIKYY